VEEVRKIKICQIQQSTSRRFHCIGNQWS